MDSTESYLIYALGGGMGHLTRGLALMRALRRQWSGRGSRRIVILTNSPFAQHIPWENDVAGPDQVICLAPEASTAQVAAFVRTFVRSRRWDTLIVDTFPRGLAGELADVLPSLTCRKILVHRDLNPRYASMSSVRQSTSFYDHILVPGEDAPFAHLRTALMTAPWYIRDHDELLPGGIARAQLGCDDGSVPLAVIVGSGSAPEVGQMQEVSQRLQEHVKDRAIVRFLQPSKDRAHTPLWPLIKLAQGTSVWIGSGGYNTVHEARATNTPLLAIARPRLYDRQRERLRPAERATCIRELLVRAVTLLRSRRFQTTRQSPPYANGAREAAQLLT